MTYERENIARMTGYIPGEQPEDIGVIKLNTIETPYPPPEPVLNVLKIITADQLRRYPNPTARNFRAAAAKAHNLSPEHIIAVNGGDELLRMIVTTFVDPHQVIGYADPSYSLYPVLAAVQDAKVFRVPMTDDWQLPADYADQLNRVQAKLAFIVNPHAPSGTLTAVDQLRRIAQNFHGVLVIDEAYVDFVDPDLNHDAAQLIRDGVNNVILLRSMSKGYSLAGLRFGYGIAAPSLIDPMQTRTKDSYNTDAVSQALAAAAIENRNLASKSWVAVRNERLRLTDELRAMGFDVPDSQSNFILAQPPAGNAAQLYAALKDRKILIRYFDADRLNDKLRITIGTPQQNTVLLDALKQLI